MASSIQFFSLPETLDVTKYKSGCIITPDHELFTVHRTKVRGLEERIVIKSHPEHIIPEDHNFVSGTYVYKLTNVNDKSIYIRFEPGLAIFGSDILYGC
ncbi:MAG: hypothetical protein NC548_13190 [Lachnospiraceae bacterium]|nr:hypothetical protein [Lachnospiraceae bacterium]MCM1230655.1 hypothetical protein [Ruminococcus flavefaciens]MCM1439989.1 hypothetical protein [Roseburia sp.]